MFNKLLSNLNLQIFWYKQIDECVCLQKDDPVSTEVHGALERFPCINDIQILKISTVRQTCKLVVGYSTEEVVNIYFYVRTIVLTWCAKLGWFRIQ